MHNLYYEDRFQASAVSTIRATPFAAAGRLGLIQKLGFPRFQADVRRGIEKLGRDGGVE
jgi:hypothetical protein